MTSEVYLHGPDGNTCENIRCHCLEMYMIKSCVSGGFVIIKCWESLQELASHSKVLQRKSLRTPQQQITGPFVRCMLAVSLSLCRSVLVSNWTCPKYTFKYCPSSASCTKLCLSQIINSIVSPSCAMHASGLTGERRIVFSADSGGQSAEWAAGNASGGPSQEFRQFLWFILRFKRGRETVAQQLGVAYCSRWFWFAKLRAAAWWQAFMSVAWPWAPDHVLLVNIGSIYNSVYIGYNRHENLNRPLNYLFGVFQDVSTLCFRKSLGSESLKASSKLARCCHEFWKYDDEKF